MYNMDEYGLKPTVGLCFKRESEINTDSSNKCSPQGHQWFIST